jgi:hypothetical protein
MKLFTTLMVCCALAGCSNTPAAQSPTSPPAAGATAAAKPDATKAVKHFKEHVKYPASRAVILAACADTPEFTADEKKWLSDNLPEKTYSSADDVVAALHL